LSPFIIGLIGVIAFLVLVFNNMPVGFAFAITGCAGLILIRGFDATLGVLGTAPFAWATADALIPLPLFVLMGLFAFYAGISRDLYDTAYKWLGRFRGGLALATMGACTGFAACCGSSLAGAATMAAVSYPEMEKSNYDRSLATGVICAGGALAILIPPSIGFILFGFFSGTSIAELFIAGILPGVLQAVMFLITIYWMCRLNPQLGPAGPSFSWKEMLASLRGVWGMLVLFLLVIGGLYLGIFSANEAGAIGAFGAFLVALVGRRLTMPRLSGALKETARTTCFILTLVIGANIFNTFLSVSGFQAAFSHAIGSLTLPPYVILAIVLFIYIPLGMVMEMGAVIILTVPTLVPSLMALGFDPVLLGVLIVVLMELGFLTPPVGLNAFVVHDVTKVPLTKVFRGITPFAIIMVVEVIILAAFPRISLFLPDLMSKH
jgi:tripartite ATP-independent transporter DctM subunit